jgi:hypothetical protein
MDRIDLKMQKPAHAVRAKRHTYCVRVSALENIYKIKLSPS